MKKGNYVLLIIAFFFLVNYSLNAFGVFFFREVLYIFLLIFTFLVFREFDFSKIQRPIILWVSSIIFSYGLFQKYYIFPKIISNYTQKQDFFSTSIYGLFSTGRIFSIFTLPTLYGVICAIFIVFIFHFIRESFLKEKKITGKIYFYFFLLCLGVYNLILTQSFGAIIYLSVGMFIYLIIDRTINVKYISLIVMTLFLVIFIVVGLRYKQAKNLEPVKLRLTNWNQAVRMITANPFFGVGLGNYGLKVSYYTKQGEAKSLYTHNFFLQITAEIGIPSLFFLILIFLIYRRKLIPPDYKEKSIYISVLIMLIFYNLIDIGLYFFSVGIIFSIVLSQIYRKKTSKIVIKIFMFFLCSLIYGLMYLSDDYLSEANIFLNQNDIISARKFYEKSISINPLNYSALLGKASLLPNGINSKQGLELIDKALDVFPEYGVALFQKSVIEYKNGHFLSALYYAGAANKKNQLNKQYRNWYEFIKKNLPSRNTIKRN